MRDGEAILLGRWRGGRKFLGSKAGSLQGGQSRLSSQCFNEMFLPYFLLSGGIIFKNKELKMQYPTLIPCFTVIDSKKSIEFYKSAFGFTCARPEDDYIEMRYKDVVIMFGKEGQFEGDTSKAPKTSGVKIPLTLYIYCDDVDAFYKNALKNGAKSLAEPQDTFWGDRFCKLEDIDGYEWSFAKRI